MRKLIMWNVVTLDGYFEGSKPWDLDFHQTVWGPELQAYIAEQLQTTEMIIYGQKTYEGMASYWTNAGGDQAETAEQLNKLPKIVCSKTLESADWNNTSIVRDAVTELQQLKQEGDGNMFVFGSGILSESLMHANLFDEYRLCIAPVFLGKGRRLFAEGIPYQKLKLVDERRFQTGGVIVMYVPAAT